jgi:hypothetical protein
MTGGESQPTMTHDAAHVRAVPPAREVLEEDHQQVRSNV